MLLILFACSFALMQKNQKIKDDMNAPRIRPCQRLPLCCWLVCFYNQCNQLNLINRGSDNINAQQFVKQLYKSSIERCERNAKHSSRQNKNNYERDKCCLSSVLDFFVTFF